MHGPDYIVDIDGIHPSDQGDADKTQKQRRDDFRSRPWLAIRWKCCSTYSRIYRNAAGDAYEGRCPRCSRSVNLKIGPGGTASRFFEAE